MEAVEQRYNDNETSWVGHHARLAQLYRAISKHLDEKYITRLIDHETNVNFQVPDDFFQKIRKPELVGSTILHYALSERNLEAFDYLLKIGADCTIKNAAGSTVLHEALEIACNELVDGVEVKNSFVSLIQSLIIRVHVKDGNFMNPCNKHGLSHFHAACLANNVQAVELFLTYGVSANHSVNADSPVFPGYTPLHFAAMCSSFDTAAILFQYNADCKIKDVNGTTVLHVLVQNQLKFIERRNMKEEGEADDVFAKEFENNEKMLKLLLTNSETDFNDDIGLSTLHVACTMQDTSLVEFLLPNILDIDHCVRTDSPLWPGYTAFHFAALSNIHTVKLLLKYGANIEAQNTEGISPFDMCLERYRINDISYLISCHQNWKDIHFSDSEIKLTDFINALHYTSKLIYMARYFLVSSDSSLPFDSPLWPGSTPLHLAVIFFERNKAKFHIKHKEDEDDDGDDGENENESTTKVIELLLNYNYFKPTANILAQDAYGSTPIHLAFKAQKRNIFRFLLERNDKIENPSDIDNFSFLHIACLMKNDCLLKELLFIGQDPNIPILSDIKVNLPKCDVVSAGSTPLHIAMLNEDDNAINKLLLSGADPLAQDVNGISPIHRLVASGIENHCRMFTMWSDQTNIEITSGITNLHIACMVGDRKAVKQLIESGADVNATINFHMPMDSYSTELVKLMTPRLGMTPLHFALQYDCVNVAEILFASGVDLFAKIHEKPPVIYDILQNHYVKYANMLLLHLRFNEGMRKNFQNKTGMTLLHIACNAVDVTLVRYLLNNGEQVNIQAHLDSPVWPGCTPLHILLKNLNDRLDRYGYSRNRYIDNVPVILKLLMDNGADVTLKNADNETPVDISKKLYQSHICTKIWLCTALPLDNYDYYDLNFVDNSGISLFQEACCRNNITIIKELLKRRVDVNQRIDAFANEYSGYTPLHFAAKQRCESLIGSSMQLTTIELLFNHGADFHAKDVNGNTPLHIAVERGSSREELISMFIKFGANVNATNILGRTPFEELLMSLNVSNAEVEVFLKNGVRINGYNCITGIGYVPLLIQSDTIDFYSIIKTIIDNATDINEADDKGRTLIHNIVSHGKDINTQIKLSNVYVDFIEHGCDIDHQDKLGRTALHIAVQWENDTAVDQLLEMNADASIVDNEGKTAIDYILDMCTCENPCKDSTHMWNRYSLAVQLVKFELTGFQEFTKYNDLKIDHSHHTLYSFRKNFKKAKKTYIIPRELTLFDFVSETGVVSSFLHMPILKRNVVDEFFKSMNDAHFGDISLWLKNHYQKALVRPTLVESAKNSLNSLIRFSLPHLCSDNIFRFLSNVELKNVIAATATADSDKA